MTKVKLYFSKKNPTMDRIYLFKNAEVYYGEDKTMTNLKNYFNYVRDFKIRITSDKIINNIVFSKKIPPGAWVLFETFTNFIIRNKDRITKSYSYIDWLKLNNYEHSDDMNLISLQDLMYQDCTTGKYGIKNSCITVYDNVTTREENLLNTTIRDSHKPDEHWTVDLTRFGSCFISGSETELDNDKILNWEPDSSDILSPFSLPDKKNGRRVLLICQPELLTFVCIDSSKRECSQNYLNLYTHNNNNGIICG